MFILCPPRWECKWRDVHRAVRRLAKRHRGGTVEKGKKIPHSRRLRGRAGLPGRLRCDDVEPELKLVHVAQHFVQLRAITGNFHVAFLFSLLQGFLLQDDFV